MNDLLQVGRQTIEKEAQALAALVNSLDDNFVRAGQRIFDCRGTVLLTGMGKSGLVARKWASSFCSTGTRAYFINPAEAPHGDLGIMRADDLLIALSFSGETEELGYILRHARENGIPSIGVTGNPNSSLARQSTVVLSLELSEEACPLGLAPTTSTTLMMALGDALAVTLMTMRGFTETEFARLHPGGSLGRRLWLRVESLMHSGDSIPKVRPDDALEKVLVEMTRKRLGLAVVMTGNQIAGVVTDGDLRRYFQKRGLDKDATATDLMTRSPKTVSPKALVVEAREMMEAHSIHQLLVVNGSTLLGVIHLQDLLQAKAL